MRSAILLATAAVGVFAATQLRLDDGVVVLEDGNFEHAMDTYDVLMIEFYAPWCGHCKELAPKYKEAAKKLRASGEAVALAKCDATKQEKMAEKWKVESFPQMWTFAGGDKKGQRPKIKGEVQELISHMKGLRKSNPLKPSKQIKGKKGATKFAKGYASVLGIFESDSGAEAEAFAAVERLQGHRGHVKFAYTTSSEVAETYGVTAPTVLLLKKYDNGKDVADANILTDPVSLDSWVTAHSTEVVCDVGEEGKSDCGGNHPMTIFLGAAKHKEEKKAFAAAAAKMRGAGKDMHFGRMSKSHKAVKEFFEVDDDELPTIVVTKKAGIYDGSKVKYMIDKNEYPDITQEVVEEVVDTFLAGDLEPTVKSQEPVDDEDKAMKEIVGLDFSERVLESEGKDVLMMLYAPWCSMCKKLKPPYDQVADVFADIDSVVISKMDATANDVDYDGMSLSGYPTLYFFDGKSKKPKLMDSWSDLNVESFKSFLKKEAATPYDEGKLKSYEKIVQKEEENDQPMAPKTVGASADPEPDDNSNLKVLVGSNFKERVIDSEKAWLIDFYAPWCGHCKTLMPKIKGLADEMAKDGAAMVGKCDLTVNDIASIHPMVTAEGRGYPMLMFFQEDKSQDPLYYEGPKYVDDMASWLRGGWKTNRKGKAIKSADAVDDSKDDLKTIVGSQFHERVIATETPTMMMFAAPWCGVCKKAKPEFAKVAKEMGDKVLCGYFDMTANELDHPKVQVEGYPTFYYFPGDDKNNPVKYSGGKDYDALFQFVDEQVREEEEDPGEDDL